MGMICEGKIEEEVAVGVNVISKEEFDATGGGGTIAV